MNKYKEALERARMSYYTGDYNKDTLEMLEIIFPELKKSKGERIREEIISYIKSSGAVTNQEWIAWLEKQGKQKPAETLEEAWKEMRLEVWAQASGNKPRNESDDSTKMFSLCDIDEIIEKIGEKQIVEQVSYPSFTFDDVLALQCAMARVKKSDEKLYEALQSLHDRVHDIYHDEQKENEEPADKIESKFHKGEWITNGEYTWKIVDVKPLDYILQSQDGNIANDTISYVDKQFHSFTIQDAKDGDVLVHSSFMFDDFIFIYNNTSILQAYCYYSNEINKFIIEDKGHPCPWNMQEVTPATKEQHDLLFKKMSETGYEWDDTKLELRQIEQNNEQSIDSVNHSMYIRCLGILSMIKCGIEVTEVDEELEWLKSMAKWN